MNAEPPRNRRKFAIVGALFLGLIGLAIGSVVGIATAGFGVVAAFFTVPIGLYSGYKIGAWSAAKQDGPSCPGCSHHFTSSGLL